MRLGWKQGQKNQAYYENSQITAVKSFTTLGPGPGKTIFLNKGQRRDIILTNKNSQNILR